MKVLAPLTKLFLIIIVLVFSGIGCSSHTEETERHSSTEYGDGTAEQRTTVTETKVENYGDNGCSGVLSCTVDFTGEVLAFPFRLIGGLFSAIF